MPVLAPEVARYLEDLRPERSALMGEMEALARADGVPIVAWETGRFLATLVAALQPRKVLEVGTAIGYSALHMAEKLDGGRLVSIERDPERAARAREFLARGGVADRVEIVEDDALTALRRLEGPWDLLFLDATKDESEDYLELAEAQASPRAVLVVDNLLMRGEVALSEEADTFWNPESLAAARRFNSRLTSDPRWLGSVLPIGDGVGFAVRQDA